MSRVAIVAAAFAAITVAVPASGAALYRFDYEAYATGTQFTRVDPATVDRCDIESDNLCAVRTPFSVTVLGSTTYASEDGEGSFIEGDRTGFRALYSGQISGGFDERGFPDFIGRDLYYSIRAGDGQSFDQLAYAGTFYVRLISVNGQPPLPEPSTWAMMIVGFAITGTALRRRTAVPLLR